MAKRSHMESEGILSTLGYSLINFERWKYFCSLQSDELTGSMLFAMQHQSILRVLSDTEEDVSTLVSRYFFNPDFRLECLAQLQTSPKNLSLPEELDQSSDYKMITDVCWQLFESSVLPTINNWGGEFANKLGFAAFHKHKLFNFQEHHFAEITSTREGSIEALIYYCFNVHAAHESVFCVQLKPIEILAHIFFLYSEHGFPEGCAHQEKDVRMLQELRLARETLQTPEDFFKALKTVFMLHEIGHTLSCNGKSPVLDTLFSHGFCKADVPVLDFPTDYYLDAWNRVKSGKKNVDDVLFLLGDLLANMTVLSAGLDEPMLALLRAFNWRLVSHPNPRRRPRGNISFLAYSSTTKYTQLFTNDLSDILVCIKSDGCNLEQLLQQIEYRNWNELALSS